MATMDEILANLQKRLMPSGMEWPRHESGEPVCIGDDFIDHKGLLRKVERIVLMEDGYSLVSKIGTYCLRRYGESVKRPAVLAADGLPLDDGQTVWMTEPPYSQHIIRDARDGHVNFYDAVSADCPADKITHQRPVLDADGVPIELGDDLYSVEGGLKLHVSNIDRVNCRIATSAMFALDKWADPSMFTHTKPEPPDSWGRIEKDFETLVCTTAQDVYHGIDVSKELCDGIRGIARRCKALAERGE